MNRATRGVFDTVSTISIMPNEITDSAANATAAPRMPGTVAT